jgi:hypothetical protein
MKNAGYIKNLTHPQPVLLFKDSSVLVCECSTPGLFLSKRDDTVVFDAPDNDLRGPNI